MKRLLYILCVCFIYAQPTACASSSSDATTSVTTPIKRRLIRIARDVFEHKLEHDNHHYTSTLELLNDAHNVSDEICIVRNIFEGGMPTHIPTRKEYISPLLYALYTNRLRLALQIAVQLPHYIDVPDEQGNLPLSYLIETPYLTRMFDNLQRLFAHQVNIPNLEGITPIFKTTNMEKFFKLYMIGAELDAATIARIHPSRWRNEGILTFLHYVGFNSKFLATTFNYYETTLLNASQRLAPNIRNKMLAETTSMIGSPLQPALDVREQVGWHAKRELHARTQFTKHNNPESRKRSQRPYNGPTYTLQHQRTS